MAPDITGAVFTGNSAEGEGAIYSNSFLASLSCGDCTFRDNTATGDGGAVIDWGNVDGGLSGTFAAGGNGGGDGGAVWLSDNGGNGLSGTFRSNTAGGNGGAVYIDADDLDDYITGSFIAWNAAGGNGGAIYDGGDDTGPAAG